MTDDDRQRQAEYDQHVEDTDATMDIGLGRPVRLAHCTPTIGGHNPLCDRDGEFCSASVVHDGPCTPHGGTR